jgi:ribonuclease P protein component
LERLLLAPQIPSDRLTGRRQFDAVFAHNWTVAGRYFVVRTWSSGLPGARLGIIAARKAIRRAVDRNTCKRIVRVLFHERKECLGGLDVVVICRVAVYGSARADARRELARLLTGIGENKSRRAASGATTGNAQVKQ